LEGAEGVVLDFGVCGRGALADEVEVDGCGEGRGGEEDQPDVDAEFGLGGVVSGAWEPCALGG
jgi:hypothetical protein